jgi:hypothetical protein
MPIGRAMASKLRLHVILPVAVLGLLGLGVGAFALGRGPADGSQEPLPTLAGTTTAPQERESRWARQANALCERVTAKLQALELPEEPEDVDDYFAAVISVQDKAFAKFSKLGWPKGQKAAALSLRADFEEYVSLSHQALRALRSGDGASLDRIDTRARALSRRWNKGMERLGAPVCAGDSLGASTDRAIKRFGSAHAALNNQLARHRVVVVLLYAPGDDYDTIQTRETRAGALASGAGFLALNVKKNRQVAALAAQYEVRQAPATLVFTRGPRLAYRVAGFLDRDAVAQAVANARA